MDLVATEERWPGMEPDASMYWYEANENPNHWNWPRHRIVNQYSMNNLDVADMDNDGDPDLVTCEHKGQAEQLQVWENDGSGNFTCHVIDKGKEGHAGARLSDLDNDGDLDIISIAWNDFEFLHIWRNDAIMNGGTGSSKAIPLGFELTDDYTHFIPVTITSHQWDFHDKIIEVDLDLPGNFDPGSIRVVEVDENGEIINDRVVYQVERKHDNLRKGKVVFRLKGNLPGGSSRNFKILCGPAGGYYIIPVFPKLVHYDNHILHQGQRSFQMVTEGTAYSYHRNGAGFASMIDRDGNDWISYKPGGGSSGEYRGIPNIRPAGFHPGYTDLRSWIVHSGPVKTTFQSETEDGSWACLWEVYPDYATMTLLTKGEGNYWLLYEGTPGGLLDVEDDYWVMSDGTKLSVSEDWTGTLPDPEWVWFGDKKCDRVLFLAKHEHDDKVDQFWQMQGNMTVFGFGRKPHENPGTYMDEVPVHLTIGFAESSDNDKIIPVIRSAVYSPEIKAGKIQPISK
jgi:hypothetical protein